MKSKKKSLKIKRNDPAISLETRIRSSIGQFLFPLEQGLQQLKAEFDNFKANLITTQNLLERKGILTSEEFYKEYNELISSEIGTPSKEGNLSGKPEFSLYNLENLDENS